MVDSLNTKNPQLRLTKPHYCTWRGIIGNEHEVIFGKRNIQVIKAVYPL